MAKTSENRFESTVDNFIDCYRALERITNEGESVSKREWQCAHAMYIYALNYVEAYENGINSNVQINFSD